MESTIAALEARCSRLSSELEEAAVAVEVLRAKGRQYDELEARADRAVRWGMRLAGERRGLGGGTEMLARCSG